MLDQSITRGSGRQGPDDPERTAERLANAAIAAASPSASIRQAVNDALASNPVLLADLRGAGLDVRVMGFDPATAASSRVDIEGAARQQVRTLATLVHRAWLRAPDGWFDDDRHLVQMQGELRMLRDIAEGGSAWYLEAFDAAAPWANDDGPFLPPYDEARLELLRQLEAIRAITG